jgi:hypothetical protein
LFSSFFTTTAATSTPDRRSSAKTTEFVNDSRERSHCISDLDFGKPPIAEQETALPRLR